MFKVDKEKCVGCGACVNVCPADAIYPGTQSRQDVSLNQGQIFPEGGFGMGRVLGRGRGRGMGRRLGRGPRGGKGGGHGGGRKW